MTDITKLPDRWRSKQDVYPSIAREDCLVDLHNALPVWTRITDDPDTWPEDGTYLWCYGSIGSDTLIHATYDVSMMRVIADMVERTCWRPLCSIDYPPEDTHE